MDMFNFEFDTDSILTNESNSDSSDLDWAAFQSSSPPTWLSQQDDAVAPNNRSNNQIKPNEDDINFEIEQIFNGLNQPQAQHEQRIIDPIHTNIHTPGPSYVEPSYRMHLSSVNNQRQQDSLPGPLVPRLSSSRSQCFHKLPDRAVKLMHEWYNANLDDPYPSSPERKRFITEGNITAQQCRSWFANRRQRLKHVKQKQPRASFSHLHHSIQSKLAQILSTEEQSNYYEQQPHITASTLPFSFTSTPTTGTATTTVNVVINEQTIEQLIHNGLRKILYPAEM